MKEFTVIIEAGDRAELSQQLLEAYQAVTANEFKANCETPSEMHVDEQRTITSSLGREICLCRVR